MPDVPDNDAAYALIAGMSEAEQERVLRALLTDMDEDAVEAILRDEGILDD